MSEVEAWLLRYRRYFKKE